MSQCEQDFINRCYSHFKETGSKEFTCFARNGNDLYCIASAVESLEKAGYISRVSDNGFSFTVIIEDALICYVEKAES